MLTGILICPTTPNGESFALTGADVVSSYLVAKLTGDNL